MKVKVLRDAIANLPEDMEVVIADVEDACLEVIRVCVAAPIVYLETRQEFPSEWFDEKTQQERRWINGSPVILNPEPMKYESIMDIGGREKEVELQLYDGYGEGEGVKVRYPKLEDLDDEQIEDMDKQLGGRISDSGSVLLEDVCCCYGEIDNEISPKEEPAPNNPKPKIELTREMHLVCETIQEVTMHAWPVVWADNKYDQDSRNVLETLREWGVEFENWWLNHDGDWIDDHDYLEEVWKFTDKKCEQYLEQFKD